MLYSLGREVSAEVIIIDVLCNSLPPKGVLLVLPPNLLWFPLMKINSVNT